MSGKGQRIKRKYRKHRTSICKYCGEEIDRTDMPRGAMNKHYYEAHPELKQKILDSLTKARIKSMAITTKAITTKHKKVEKEASLAQEDTSQQEQSVESEISEENPAVEASESQNGNGHQEVELGIEDEDTDSNIFLRTASRTPLAPRAMIPRMMRADSFGEAQIAAIVPKTIVINPTLIQIGMGITINEWGWDPKMSPGVWLDKVIYWFFWYCGYEVTPYRRLSEDEIRAAFAVEGGGNGRQ